MAGGSRRGGDVVLGGRHLIGIFALLVMVLGIVFTLGYLLGRSRYEEQLRAATESGESASGSAASAGRADAPPPADWDFYRSAEPPKPAERLAAASEPAAPPERPADAPATAGKPAAATAVPVGSNLIPKGAITLQVAALLREADAVALAQALQEKKFPAIVTTPTSDRYYRVQIGPYMDASSANAARRELEKQGFKSIVRR
jgi:cell division septation protein DedD